MRETKALTLDRILEGAISPALDAEILALLQAAFPDTEAFQTRRWATAEPHAADLWFAARLDGRLVGAALVMHRRICTSAGELAVGGIANVCSDPHARGLGAAKAYMQAAQRYIADGGEVDYGMLICRDRVRDFYAKLGWSAVDNAISMQGADGKAAPLRSRNTMIWPGRRAVETWPRGPIDLNGPRW